MTRKPFFVRALFFGGLLVGIVPLVLAGTVRIDFGRNDGTNGNPTANPDSNGNYWNNIVSDFVVPTGLAATKLIDTTNTRTPIGVTLGAGWKANGKLNGGLLVPSAVLLGDIAIGTATEDYFYVEGATSKATITVSGLDPEKLYNFRFFGTRNGTSGTDVRKSTFKITAASGTSSVELQTTGPDIGNDGIYDGNDKTIVVLNNVQANTSSQVELELAVTAPGTFAYLGVMEIIEGAAAPRIPTASSVRIDFGRNDGANGNPTVNPDSKGNYWNNVTSDFDVTPGVWAAELVATNNTPTPIGVVFSSGWRANGRNSGGLLAPNGPTNALLGDFAVETATEDFFYVEGASAKATLTITGLSPTKRYNLRLFGTRNSTDIRQTTYKATASSGVSTVALQTSGPGIGANGTYNGNDNTIVVIPNIQADLSKEIQLEVATTMGNFSYLAALEITESVATVPALVATPPASEQSVVRWVQQDVLDPIDPGSLLFVGSSSIRRWEQLQKDFSDYRITQRGYGGSFLDRLDDVAGYIARPYQPAGIVMWAGTNDIKLGGHTGALVRDNFRIFVGNMRSRQPTVPIFFLAITPTPAYALDAPADARRKDANALVKTLCDADPTLHFVDLASYFENVQVNTPAEFQSYYADDTHFSKKGYDVWKSILRPQLAADVVPNKEFITNPNTLTAGESLLFDFGPNDVTNGDATNGADARGHFWNNWHATNGGGTVNSGEHLKNLVKTTGANSGVRMTITGGFQVNGKLTGGLLSPNGPTFPLLGDLAVQTATEDYFYSSGDDRYNLGSDDVPGGFMLEGLDPTKFYEIRLFGSRDNAETRVTEYAVVGLNSKKKNLQTSGVDIGSNGTYDGNDDEITVLKNVVPDAFGQIFLDQTAITSEFAYINAMEIKATATVKPVDFWRIGNFTSIDLDNPGLEASVWGDTANPDTDGQNNLLEYATGTAPKVSGVSPVTGRIEQIGPDQFYTLIYQKNQAATDVSYQVEASDNLVFSQNIADSFVSAAAGLEIRQATVPMAGFPSRFLRLKVGLNP